MNSQYITQKFRDDEWDKIVEIGKTRTKLHDGFKSQSKLNPEWHDAIGVAGEYLFQNILGLPMIIDSTILTDDGVDFLPHPDLSIDIKTFLKPHNLLVQADKIDTGAKIYVLAGCDINNCAAWLIGWEYAHIMKACPVKQFREGAPYNHYKYCRELRSITDLKELIVCLSLKK